MATVRKLGEGQMLILADYWISRGSLEGRAATGGGDSLFSLTIKYCAVLWRVEERQSERAEVG